MSQVAHLHVLVTYSCTLLGSLWSTLLHCAIPTLCRLSDPFIFPGRFIASLVNSPFNLPGGLLFCTGYVYPPPPPPPAVNARGADFSLLILQPQQVAVSTCHIVLVVVGPTYRTLLYIINGVNCLTENKTTSYTRLDGRHRFVFTSVIPANYSLLFSVFDF